LVLTGAFQRFVNIQQTIVRHELTSLAVNDWSTCFVWLSFGDIRNFFENRLLTQCLCRTIKVSASSAVILGVTTLIQPYWNSNMHTDLPMNGFTYCVSIPLAVGASNIKCPRFEISATNWSPHNSLLQVPATSAKWNWGRFAASVVT
jgi:hypothetical protein